MLGRFYSESLLPKTNHALLPPIFFSPLPSLYPVPLPGVFYELITTLDDTLGSLFAQLYMP